MKKVIEENLKVLIELPWWAIGRVVERWNLTPASSLTAARERLWSECERI
jgi:hypothetical protein